jgi:outer membrane protein
MKKILFLAFCLFSFASVTKAQRYAIIDTKYILDKIPEYKDANKKLEEMADAWQKEIDLMQADLDKMYRQLDAERAMLTPELMKKR